MSLKMDFSDSDIAAELNGEIDSEKCQEHAARFMEISAIDFMDMNSILYCYEMPCQLGCPFQKNWGGV
jgi:hypothetical protein